MDSAASYGGSDLFAVYLASYKPNTFFTFNLGFVDSTGKAINGDHVPAHLDTSTFGYQALSFSSFGMSDVLNVSMSMSSVQAVVEDDASAVPEPGAIFLLMAGIGALVFAVSRRTATRK